MERFVQVDADVRLWVCDEGHSAGSPLLLIMGANASALAWPDELVEQLGRRHRVIRYDHRDTGRSTWAFDEHPYAIADLAADAIGVLDALGVQRAHVVGMSMGGTLVQLLLLDHPDRLLSATLLCTCALGVGAAAAESSHRPDLPGPDPRLLALWEHMNEPRDPAAELEWRVEHWRLLNGDGIDFDAEEFRRLEERILEHAGRFDNPAAHAQADQRGLDRGAELARVTVPTLVIEAPGRSHQSAPALRLSRRSHRRRTSGDDSRHGSRTQQAGGRSGCRIGPCPHGSRRRNWTQATPHR